MPGGAMDIEATHGGGRHRRADDMPTQTRRHTARIKRPITKQTVDALQPADKSFIAWDDRLTGFGVRVLPSGTKSFILNYRPGGGGRKALNRRIVLGRCERTAPDQARRMAEEMLVRIAAGEDPAAERARARAMPTLREAFEEFLAAGPERKAGTITVYRRNFHRHLGSLLERPLDTITARDVEQCFSRLTAEAGWVPANNAIRMLRSLYLRRCIDIEGAACKTLLDSVPRKNYKDSIYGVAWLMVRF